MHELRYSIPASHPFRSNRNTAWIKMMVFTRKWALLFVRLLVTIITITSICLLLINDKEEISPSLAITASQQRSAMSVDCNGVVNRYNISMNKYVLALNYWEQLTMATRSLCRLGQFAKGWEARTVIPFTLNSELWGLPSNLRFQENGITSPTYDHYGILKPLDSLYNMTLFNADLLCIRNQVPPFATIEDFILHGNRSITLIHHSYNGRTPYLKSVTNNNYINCLDTMAFRKLSKIILKYLNKETIKRGVSSFRVGTVCCVNHRHITTPQEMAEKCGFSNQQSLSVIMTVWRGYSSIFNKSFRLVVPKDFPSFAFDHPFPLSDGILSNVSAYLGDIAKGKDFIAVHFRTAKIGTVQGNITPSQCFKKTWELIRQIQIQHIELTVKYFVDYGPYGSQSMAYGRKISKGPFQENRVIPLHYDPSIYGGIEDSGYVSLVEQGTIAKAMVLVLVGGGSFQHHILYRYLMDKKYQQLNVYTVCWKKSDIKGFKNSINISPVD